MIKYKPWKLIFIMILLSVLGTAFTFLLYKSDEIVEFILLIFCMSIINIFTIVVLFYFVELHEDKIVFRQGFFLTKNKKNPFMVKESWLSTFFVNTIYFDDVENVVFGQNNQMELIMKDDSRMLISFGGYTKKIQSKIIAKLKK